MAVTAWMRLGNQLVNSLKTVSMSWRVICLNKNSASPSWRLEFFLRATAKRRPSASQAASSAQHLRHQARVLQKRAGVVEVTAEEAAGHQAGGDHFGIGEAAARVFPMMPELERVINDGVNEATNNQQATDWRANWPR